MGVMVSFELSQELTEQICEHSLYIGRRLSAFLKEVENSNGNYQWFVEDQSLCVKSGTAETVVFKLTAKKVSLQTQKGTFYFGNHRVVIEDIDINTIGMTYEVEIIKYVLGKAEVSYTVHATDQVAPNTITISRHMLSGDVTEIVDVLDTVSRIIG